MMLWAQPVLTCYDIQYTTSTNGDSPYMGQSVTVQGIVTMDRYYTGSSSSNYRGFFISDSGGGPWSGLFIYTNSYFPAVGDLVRLTGTIIEYYGFTEMSPVTSYQVISQGNPLPEPSLVSTGSLTSQSTGEQWESVFVKVQNVSVTSLPNTYQEFYVTDGTGAAQIDNQGMPWGHSWTGIQQGQSFAEIRGVVDYSYNTFAINPRSDLDLIQDYNSVNLAVPNLTVNLNNPFSVPIVTSGLNADSGYMDYSLNLVYNPAVIEYTGISTNETLSQYGTVIVDPTSGNINISYQSTAVLSGEGSLINVNFTATHTGISSLSIQNASFGENTDITTIDGSITVNASYNSLGDTLTVIQHPILNIPEIVIPGESMTITCLTPTTTSGWQANLKHGSKTINLPVYGSQYVTNPDRWLLQVQIPNVNVFELYDLEVIASGGIHDITRNAVHVVPTRKTNYYFAHITDLHMPTRVYWPDAGFDTDSLAVMDFRAVMDDLNLIRPEFVLITGDIINEGELEGFAGQYWYGWAQKVLSELRIPFYLTSGNHDIGGWNATPPPQGSSRKNWWRYFGWSWLDNVNYTWGMHTQDYSFTYNGIHFIGMESYINYDNFRSYIYGGQSYTINQMNWLNSTLALYPSYTKVLFHHYDFSDQLNLSTLGINMSLWGHVHSNQGSITVQPYNLATRSVCDGNRAYRIIRVNGTQLLPTTTIYAGTNGQNISHSFYPNNYGLVDSVHAVIVNNQNMPFENTLLTFKLPYGSSDFSVLGGVLEQVDNSGDKVVCYVRVNLGASTTANVSIKANSVSINDPVLVPAALSFKNTYPNPFGSQVNIVLDSEKHSLYSVQIYDLRGRLVRQLFKGRSGVGELMHKWDGTSDNGKAVPDGVYLIRVQSGTSSSTRKVVKIGY